MIEKLQRFGGAMLTPVMLMPFAGIMIGLSTIFTNPDIVGAIANDATIWFRFWTMMYQGGYAIFNQLPLLFAITLPIGLAKQASGRAAMESFMTFMVFNYFLETILTFWGPVFHVDFTAEVGGVSGLTTIAGIKTLDTNIMGAILVSCIVIWIHNKWYQTKLPDVLSVFQGSALVVIIAFFIMIPLSFLVAFIWPIIQQGIIGLQSFLAGSGNLGVWLFTFLERITIPTGLHHFLWTPFDLGPAVVADGNWTHWMANLNEFAASTVPVKELFPSGGFALYGNCAVWGIPGIALAMYKTALPENKKKLASLLIPITATAILTGITEPIEFTFLFISPILFVLHSLLAATLSVILYIFGVVGYQGGGLIDYVTYNWIPMLNNHAGMVLKHIVIGLIFSAIYYFLFRTLIVKMDIKTPGRTKETMKLASKADLAKKDQKGSSEFTWQAEQVLMALGGKDNISSVTNCATRLRVTVKDEALVAGNEVFTEAKAHGVVRKGTSLQVIIGLTVPNVRDEFEKLL